MSPVWLRWKLWHLVVLVAVVAVGLAVATQFPWLLVALIVWGIPFYLAAGITDRFFRRHEIYRKDGTGSPWMVVRAGFFVIVFFSFVILAILGLIVVAGLLFGFH